MPPHDPPDPLRRHHVQVSGNPDSDRTIVFTHGFGTDQRAWDLVAPAFAGDFRLVRYDTAGAGRSDPAAFVQSRYLKLPAYARDLVAIGHALDLRGAIAVGHSVGAMISLLASIEAPGLFSRAVLIGASPRYLDDEGYRGGFGKADLDEIYRHIMGNYPGWVEAFAPAAMGNPGRPELAAHFASTLKAVPASHALTIAAAIFQSDHRADLARVDIPTLVLQSHGDIAVPEEVAHYLHANLRGSRLAFVDAEGHLPHLSAPAEVVAAMDGFVRDGGR